ncbi:MaoC family dehydratase [Maritimibacter sp. DP1N21-5]|uniref:MaoC family dehydratase n=1 Tax=Maritimibacter sp. DP1N21-5 TaxID=2836867 RepID=UPI001C458B89|nr:MaoC family dehydratase [Maritimibacter sp. DP1N21-5]MBV7408664.1 MaoC family dehydratase [Maritimibacter sp. DP1N21-5]
MAQHYFEDMPVGFSFTTGSRVLTREDIVGFARDWDPQPFHLEEAAAAKSHFGTLIGSGWQTLLVCFNLAMEAGVWDEASMGASGMDEVRWLKPSLPGDEIYAVGEVISAEPSRRGDRGYVRFAYDVMRKREGGDEKIASYIGNHIIKTRSGAA